MNLHYGLGFQKHDNPEHYSNLASVSLFIPLSVDVDGNNNSEGSKSESYREYV